MQPHQADQSTGSLPQGYSQQGCPSSGVGPWGAPGRLRANAVGSVLAGLLALLTVGLLVWFAAANMVEHDTSEKWSSVVRMNVLGGFVAAGLLLVLAMVTFARVVPGAWALGVTSLLLVTMNLVAPLLRGESFSAQLDFLFGFAKPTGVAIG